MKTNNVGRAYRADKKIDRDDYLWTMDLLHLYLSKPYSNPLPQTDMYSAKKTKRYTLTIAIAIMVATISSCALIDFGPSEHQARARVQKSLPLPKTDTQQTIAQPEPIAQNWLTHVVAPGENLSTIFSDHGLSKTTLHKITTTTEFSKEIGNIHPGKLFEILVDDSGKLQALKYHPDKRTTLAVKLTEQGLESTKTVKEIERQITNAHAQINSSLFSDAKAAGLSDKLVMAIAQIFAWDIDFALDLQPGDEFTVVYEQLFLDGEKIGSGQILATEFINKGQSHVAVQYEDSHGNVGYFTPDGKSLKKAFLRTPVKFARISSRFNLRRKHPVLNKIRAHKGVDYAAPTGTPVHATGNGKVIYKGRKGGYGRVVIVQHGKQYSTLYAHLSGYHKNIKKGTRVKQSQTIGYVGKSGLATGPHLHYEFRVNGQHKNPLTVQLPKSTPVNDLEFSNFKTRTGPLLSQLASLRSSLLAQAEQITPEKTNHL